MKEEENEILKAIKALNSGGVEALQNPPRFSCSNLTHEPFRLITEPTVFGDINTQFIWGYVSTTSWQFMGDRTDIHDIFSLVWAMLMRAFGLSSPWLIDEPNCFGCDGELSGRYLVMQQCPVQIKDSNVESTRLSMNAWTAFAFHLLEDVFNWDRINHDSHLYFPPATETNLPKWAHSLNHYLNHPKDSVVMHRRYPFWIYFGSPTKGVTVVRLPKFQTQRLKSVLKPFHPEMARGEKALCLFGNGIPNAIPYSVIKKIKRILKMANDSCPRPTIIPIDSHCIFLGDKTLVAFRKDCGRVNFDKERSLLYRRRKSENSVFFFDCDIHWVLPLNPEDLEKLCVDLLEREPGVQWIKLVGRTNDRDGGRDILIDWSIPKQHNNNTEQTLESTRVDKQNTSGMLTKRIIVQIKSSKKSIGKGNVKDIRDTIERHAAYGYLLIAHPCITSHLVDHLEDIHSRTDISTDWWESRDLENRLRLHPDIAARYPNIIKIE